MTSGSGHDPINGLRGPRRWIGRIGAGDVWPPVLAGLGVALAIAIMAATALALGEPLSAMPFVTSIVLVLSLPDAAPARARALVGGHILSSLCGLLVVTLAGPGPWSAALAVGLATLLMLATDTLHPPAGIDPFLIATEGLGSSFVLGIVVPGAVTLVVFAAAWRALTSGNGRLAKGA